MNTKKFEKITQFVPICIGDSGAQTKEDALVVLGVNDNE